MERKDKKTKKSPWHILALKEKMVLAFTLLFVPASCQVFASQLHIDYSMNFSAETLGPGMTKVVVKNPWKGARKDFCYILLDTKDKDNISKANGLRDRCSIIRVPVKSMVVLSSTYYGLIDALDATNKIIGASRPATSNTPGIRRGFEQGKIKDVGQGLDVSIESILELHPEVIFTYATGGFRDIHPKLQEAGLKVIVCAEYMERHPLGRAEWIKFFGLFLDRQKEADNIFQRVRQRYIDLSKMASKRPSCPTVVTNIPFGGRWYVPGGKSFVARFIKDAGACYIFKETNSAGSIPMDLEVVYDRGKNADYWINTGTWTSLSDIARTDPRLLSFKAVRTGKIYNNNRRVNSLGGNDYWDSGVLRADRVLADLIHIFHPGLTPGYRPFYYQQLR